MGLKTTGAASASSGGGSKQEALPAASYPARLVQVIDLGVHIEHFKGEAKDPRDQMQLVWEMTDEFLLDEEGNEVEDKPRWQYQDFPLYGLGADLAKSTKTYLAIDPKKEFGGDFEMLLGMGANITLSNTPDKKDPEKFWNNITSVNPMRAKDLAKLPDLVNDTKVFDMDDPDLKVFLSLPDKMQEKIKSALNFGGGKLEALLSGSPDKGDDTKAPVEPEEDDDDLPF